jgi:hypothetical protein
MCTFSKKNTNNDKTKKNKIKEKNNINKNNKRGQEMKIIKISASSILLVM